MNSIVNQRNFERIPFNQKVRVITAGRMVAYAMVINIGMGGILLGSTSPLPVGSQCKITIPVPGGDAIKRIITEGIVVRGDDGGTAVKFTKPIEPSRFEALFREPVGIAQGSLFSSYLAYFQVSRNKDLADCEKLLGVSKQTFRTTFYISFASCISVSILAVWLARTSLPAYPNWVKVVLCFVYGTIWLAVVQPSIDLTVFRILRSRQTPRPTA